MLTYVRQKQFDELLMLFINEFIDFFFTFLLELKYSQTYRKSYKGPSLCGSGGNQRQGPWHQIPVG